MRIKIIFFTRAVYSKKKKESNLLSEYSLYVYKFNPTFSFPVFVFIFLFYFIFLYVLKAFRWIIITFCNNPRRHFENGAQWRIFLRNSEEEFNQTAYSEMIKIHFVLKLLGNVIWYRHRTFYLKKILWAWRIKSGMDQIDGKFYKFIARLNTFNVVLRVVYASDRFLENN